MSIALESNTGNRIERSGFVHGMSFTPIYDSPEARRKVNGILAADRRLPVGTTTAKNAVQELQEELESSSSSSIGRDSDSSGGEAPDGDGDSGDGEVQSSYKGSLDTMDSLEEVLPIKKGISKFYCGKSKSFTSLADASSCSSIKDIAKLENAYTRKRKNLLAHNIFFDKNRSYPLRNSSGGSGGMSKRAANSNRSTSNLAATMSSFECNNKSECSNSNSSSPTHCLPPLYPHGRRPPNNESPSSPPARNLSSWRSFSLSDLQCAAAATPSITGLVVSNGDKESKLH